MRDSSTWQEANLTVQTLPGVGGYTGAQALLQVLYGVFGGEVAACFTPSFAEASMRDWCAYGPGPVSSCNKLFGTADGETLAGIRWLQEHQQERFATYGLDYFPVPSAGGRHAAATCRVRPRALALLLFALPQRAREPRRRRRGGPQPRDARGLPALSHRQAAGPERRQGLGRL